MKVQTEPELKEPKGDEHVPRSYLSLNCNLTMIAATRALSLVTNCELKD